MIKDVNLYLDLNSKRNKYKENKYIKNSANFIPKTEAKVNLDKLNMTKSYNFDSLDQTVT